MLPAETETSIPFRRLKLAVVGITILAAAMYLIADLSNIYAGIIHGRKGQWLLALHPYARVAFMGASAIISLIAGGYCASAWLWPPIKISSAGIQIPGLLGLRRKTWIEITRIEVKGPAIKFYSAKTERSRGLLRRMPLMIHENLVTMPIGEIVEAIARYRPEVLQGRDGHA